MKRTLLLTIVVLSFFITKVPNYIELNNLKIINSLGITYIDNKYNVYLKEIIPYKSAQGISYRYKYYEAKNTSITKAISNIENNINKKIYLNKLSNIIISKNNKNEILTNCPYKSKNIIITNKNVKKMVRKI